MAEEAKQVRCPVCGTPGNPGDFCEMGCGRLPFQAASEASPSGEPPQASWCIPISPPPIPVVQEKDIPVAPGWAAAKDAGETTVFPSDPGALCSAGADLVLERDALCIFFEWVPGVLRFRLTAGRRLEGVSVEMENLLTGVRLKSRRVATMDTAARREISISVPGQEAGAVVWNLEVLYEVDGRKRSLEGEVTVLSLKPREAQKAAENLSVTINSNITNGNASDVMVSQRAVEDLAHLAHAENPFEELRKIVQGNQRAWIQTSLDRGGMTEALPPMPARAVADRLVLELGGGKLHLRVGRTVTFGRSRTFCDISLRPTPEMRGNTLVSYMQISRRHCYFEPQGRRVCIADGYRDGMRGVKPSRWGTYWNGKLIEGSKLLGPGEEGILSFAGTGPAEDGSSFRARACSTCGQCETCPRTDREWCGDGTHSSLLLTRRGGEAEAFVALWGCFDLGAVDPSFEGVTLFRERGGFAWRRGRRCGWFVPGTVLESEFGTLKVKLEI